MSNQPQNEHDEELVYEPRTEPSRGASQPQLIIFVIGLVMLGAGIALGLLYTWEIDPVIEQNTRPDQLNETAKHQYVVAIALDYGQHSLSNPNCPQPGENIENCPLQRAYRLLAEVDPSKDPFQIAADTLCELTRTGQVQSNDVEAMRQLIRLFAPQGDVEVTCDISVYATRPVAPVITPTPTFTPSPTVRPAESKTPTPNAQATVPTVAFSPTPQFSRRDFEPLSPVAFCDASRSGIIQVKVRNRNGIPVPGVEVAVSWTDLGGLQEETFFTGLKPEIDDGYADFQAEENETYQVLLVDRSGISQEMLIYECADDVLIGWEVVFQPPR